ncbi:hypothetical protein AHiyo6_23790 [Arthrobacter sp. Hiyo6]|nr:hypothetical protein AHiyo6_23790 [Arthrobacter sp. Hiyo6]
MPATDVASSLAAQSFARREAKICRCPASWARKLSCVQRMPRAAAIRSWNQLSPISAKPNHVAVIRSMRLANTVT